METKMKNKIFFDVKHRKNFFSTVFIDQRGFTLIEMLVVSIILAVAILGMESVQIYAITQIQQSDDNGTAANIAQDVMETIRSSDYSSIQTGWRNAPVYDEAYAGTVTSAYANDAKTRGRGGSLYYVSWRVLPYGSGQKVVDVIVRWYRSGTTAGSFNMTTPDPNLTAVGVGSLIVTSVISS